ncbi:MAG: phosphoribosylformylglycinamidine synthase subunit PurL [Actinomycetia bacterium]|nr:phosphoribosylformylglycinamidine synthase subunit PurL [Actinomycetes bacterium]
MENSYQPPSPPHRLLGLTDQEYQAIRQDLGREPTDAELAVYGGMWSEGCSYKSSLPYLRRLTSIAPWVVVGPGDNAGVIDVGDGWMLALRIESHNHPSYVDPHRGASTGVAGVLRDVAAMGAQPVALLNQIRFGPLSQPKSRRRMREVVDGMAEYARTVGVPIVGGEVAFSESYTDNPLVNMMCIGVLRQGELVRGEAGSPGVRLVLLGAPTGAEGIGGVSILASTGARRLESSPVAIPEGDPELARRLLDVCRELAKRGVLRGMQDLGGAGLVCAATEPATRSGVGVSLDLSAMHALGEEIDAAGLLTSETQERMLAFIDPDAVSEVLDTARAMDVPASVIGEVTATGKLLVTRQDEVVVEAPIKSLTDGAVVDHHQIGEPGWMENLWSNGIRFLRRPALGGVLLEILDDPRLASKRWVYQHYPTEARDGVMVGPGQNHALLKIPGTTKSVAVSTDGNGKLCYLDPRRGVGRLVCEAALNVAISGARPRAVVDNLNFGSPDSPDVMWQFRETVEGLAEACELLGLPVVSGNVSFHNEVDGYPIHPTPVIGVVGVADPAPLDPPGMDRAEEGMELWLLGLNNTVNLAGSSFSKVAFGHLGGRPAAADFTLCQAAVETALQLVDEGLTPVLHDISDGGLALAAAEIAISSQVGVNVTFGDWRSLFTEDPNRLLAAVWPRDVPRLLEVTSQQGLPASQVGTFGGSEISLETGGVRGAVNLAVATRTWLDAIGRRMEEDTPKS